VAEKPGTCPRPAGREEKASKLLTAAEDDLLNQKRKNFSVDVGGEREAEEDKIRRKGGAQPRSGKGLLREEARRRKGDSQN